MVYKGGIMGKETGRRSGVSVQELENFAKKNRLEVFYSIAFILAAIFSFVFFGRVWSIFAVAIGGVLGAWFPKQVGNLFGSMLQFVFKQERVTQLVLAGVGWLLAVFLPPVIFAFLGLLGGKACVSKSSIS